MKQKFLHLEENHSRLWKMFVTAVLYQHFQYNVTILKVKESNFDIIRKIHYWAQGLPRQH